jgi:hypothetical protein
MISNFQPGKVGAFLRLTPGAERILAALSRVRRAKFCTESRALILGRAFFKLGA